MLTLPAILYKGAKLAHHWIRVIAYEDMAHQASDWIPEELRVASTPRQDDPIELDFAIPKKHRLDWIRRSIQQLPH